MAVGVLALQGSFHEHVLGEYRHLALDRIPVAVLSALRRLGVIAVEVRKPEQIEGLGGLIIPGGESTTMARLAGQFNMLPALKDFASSGRPVWGTCAGLIFLADRAVGQKLGGQALVGGLDCTVHRNFFGSQVNSFEMEISVPALAASEGGPLSCRAMFIRAPAIVECGPSVEEIATCEVPLFSLDEESASTKSDVVVAVRQGNLLGTAFHPELTSDTRWHSYFLKLVQESSSSLTRKLIPTTLTEAEEKQIKDLPIFEAELPLQRPAQPVPWL